MSANSAPPDTIARCATLACLWEVTAHKPGNVYRGADFEDLTFADFVASAAVVGPILEDAPMRGVGATVRAGVAATQIAVGTNTNLGILLLLAPLAACDSQLSGERLAEVLDGLTIADAHEVYEAIRVARPGGLGQVEEADVNAEAAPQITLRDAMRLAADRDLIARQYDNCFQQVFWLANRLLHHHDHLAFDAAIVRAYLELLRDYPDSLIARKCGDEVAREAADRAATVLEISEPEGYRQAVADFDFWLRSDGHRRNPGASADMIAAALFTILRQRRLPWPVSFYGKDRRRRS